MGCLQPMGFPWVLGGSNSGRGSDFGIQQALCFVVILDPLVRYTHELPSSSFAGSDICSTWSPDPKLRRKERVNPRKTRPAAISQIWGGENETWRRAVGALQVGHCHLPVTNCMGPGIPKSVIFRAQGEGAQQKHCRYQDVSQGSSELMITPSCCLLLNVSVCSRLLGNVCFTLERFLSLQNFRTQT